MRKSTSVRLGLLLAASALLLACDRERPPERRCVDGDGRFVDEGLCASPEKVVPGAAAGSGPTGAPSEATGEWQPADGRSSGAARGGFHFIWIPYGTYGGVGTHAAGYVGGRAGPSAAPGAAGSAGATAGSVSRGGFGATGATHAGPGAAGTAAS